MFTFSGPHEVDVPPEGVDLSVVSDEPHGMSSLPAGEGVGAEPCVHNTQLGGQAGLGQVGEVLPQLTRVKLALVHNGLGGQRADVEPDPGGGDRVCRHLPEHEHLHVDVLDVHGVILRDDKHLAQHGLRAPGHRT